MGFQLIGKIIAINQIETVTSKNLSKSFQRRQVYLDCSRYDSITGEQLQENKPLLEFGGKGLEKLNELAKQGLKKGDLVSVEFAVQGTSYKDAQGNTKNYTGIRPYAIERYIPKSQQNWQQSAQGQQQGTQSNQPAPQSNAQSPFPPAPFPPAGQQGGGSDDLPF